MKKILLIIALAFCIFQMVVLAVDINVGSPAIDRDSYFGVYTIVNKDNPASAACTITKVEIFAKAALQNCEIASFYEGDANRLYTRDSVAIGAVPQLYSSHDVSLVFEAGDCIGIYYTNGSLEQDTAGYGGEWYRSGDNIPCTNAVFTFLANRTVSLYGTAITVGWDHKWNTQTISKWNTKEFTKWNGLE